MKKLKYLSLLAFPSLFALDKTMLMLDPAREMYLARPERAFDLACIFSMEVFCYSLSIAAIALIIGRAARILLPAIFLFLLTIESAELFTLSRHHFVLDGDWLLILAGSSTKEALEYLSIAPLQTLALLTAFAAVAVGGCVILAKLRFPKLSRHSIICGLCLLLPCFSLRMSIKCDRVNTGGLVIERFISDSLNTIRDYGSFIKAMRSPSLPNKIQVAQADQPLIGVFVIGESVTKHNMGIYGYDNDTTPWLNSIKNDVLVFSNVTAAGTLTETALRFMLTDELPDHPGKISFSLSQFLTRCGFECSLYSTQYRWGSFDGPVSLLFNSCKKKEFLNSSPDHTVYDQDLLPFLHDELTSGNRRKMIFLHTMGSHVDAEKRVPQKWESPKSKIPLSAYDNSIRYTDEFLMKIIEELKATPTPCFMLYVSDHGDTPRSHTMRDTSHRDIVDIPMLLWFNRAYRESFKAEVENAMDEVDDSISAANITHGFIGLTGIRDKRPMSSVHLFTRDFQSPEYR